MKSLNKPKLIKKYQNSGAIVQNDPYALAKQLEAAKYLNIPLAARVILKYTHPDRPKVTYVKFQDAMLHNLPFVADVNNPDSGWYFSYAIAKDSDNLTLTDTGKEFTNNIGGEKVDPATTYIPIDNFGRIINNEVGNVILHGLDVVPIDNTYIYDDELGWYKMPSDDLGQIYDKSKINLANTSRQFLTSLGYEHAWELSDDAAINLARATRQSIGWGGVAAIAPGAYGWLTTTNAGRSLVAGTLAGETVNLGARALGYEDYGDAASKNFGGNAMLWNLFGNPGYMWGSGLAPKIIEGTIEPVISNAAKYGTANALLNAADKYGFGEGTKALIYHGHLIPINIMNRRYFTYEYLTPMNYNKPIQRMAPVVKHMITDLEVPTKKLNATSEAWKNFKLALDDPIYGEYDKFERAPKLLFRDIAFRKWLGFEDPIDLYVPNGDGTYSLNLNLLRKYYSNGKVLVPTPLRLEHPENPVLRGAAKDMLTGNGGNVSVDVSPDLSTATMFDIWRVTPLKPWSYMPERRFKNKYVLKIVKPLADAIAKPFRNFNAEKILGGKDFTVISKMPIKKDQVTSTVTDKAGTSYTRHQYIVDFDKIDSSKLMENLRNVVLGNASEVNRESITGGTTEEGLNNFILNDIIPRLIKSGHTNIPENFTYEVRQYDPEHDVFDALLDQRSFKGQAYNSPITNDVTINGPFESQDFGLMVHEIGGHNLRYNLQPDYKPVSRYHLNKYLSHDIDEETLNVLLDSHHGTEVILPLEAEKLRDAYSFVETFAKLHPENNTKILEELGAINTLFRSHLSLNGKITGDKLNTIIDNTTDGYILNDLKEQMYTLAGIILKIEEITGIPENKIAFMSELELDSLAKQYPELQKICQKVRVAMKDVGVFAPLLPFLNKKDQAE